MSKTPKIVVLLEIERAFDRQILRGIGQYSCQHGPWIFHIVSERLDSLKPPTNLWDGLGIIARLGSKPIEELVNDARIPVVAVDSIESRSMHKLNNRKGVVCAFADPAAIARVAAEHFASRGFKQLAFVGTPDQDWSTLEYDCSEFAMWNIGRPCVINPRESMGKHHRARRRETLVDWITHLPKPIGILACDDECGFQVLEACQSAGITVPSEVAVMGVGNDELLCNLANPTLSSVALAAVEGGYRVASVLDRLMQRTVQLPQQLIISPYLAVTRSSTDIDVSQDPLVSVARSAIHRQCSQKLSIHALAESIGISRRTLELKFRRYTGRTILEEIHQARLEKAKMILKDTELPIMQVALFSGYHSVSYFINVFTKEVGLTPAKYRSAARVSEVRHRNGHGLKLAE